MIRDNETLEALLDSVRRFVRERLVPAENEVAETDEIPESIVQEMRELGLFGLTIPEQFGGLELTMEEEVRVLLELCQTSPAFRSVIGTTVGIGSQGILMDGTEEQKAQWLPKLATGEVIASFALTEPEAGSDAASLRTMAVKQGDHYIVNGTKRFITNAPHAGIFTLMARTNPADKGAGGVSSFVVDAKTPGISFGKYDKKMGQRGAHTCDVIFDNVKVPAANLIGLQEGRGFKTAMKVLESSTDAKGRPFTVHKMPIPGPLYATEEECAGVDPVDGTQERNPSVRLAGSYVNFLIVNGGIIAPSFDDPLDGPAKEILQALFPQHEVVMVPGRELLLGGGNIHCLTQQQPAPHKE